MATSELPSRAVLILRQSLTRKDSVSLDVQEEQCRAYCHDRGYTIVREPIREESIRGWQDDREVMQQVYALAQQRQYDVLVAWDQSRVARSVRILENLMHELGQHAARFESVTEPWISTPFIRQVLAAVAEEQTRTISRNVSSAKAATARRGRYLGSVPPFGYQLVKLGDAPSVLIPDEREAPIVAEIYERTARGETSTVISRDLTERGVLTRTRTVWPSSWVRQIIGRPVYRGCATLKGEVVAIDAHPPLVDDVTWHQANEALARRTITRLHPNKPSHWLSGHVVHSCGMRMYLWVARSRENGPWFQTYMCRSVYDDGKARHLCDHDRKRLSARKVAAGVRECLAHDLANIPPLATAIRCAETIAGGQEVVRQRQKLEEKRQTAIARYERVRDAWASGAEPIEWLEDERAKRDAVIADIDTAMASLPELPDHDVYERVAAQLSTLAESIAILRDDQLTTVVAQLGRVCVSAEGVQMRYWPQFHAFIPDPKLFPVQR